MITINSDRGWQRLKSWDDVISTPGYVDTLDPKAVQLDAVIGRYTEPEEKICGFSTCRRRHNRGYLITTKNGPLTNIGKDCGKTHFGVNFEEMARTMERDIDLQDKRELLTVTQSQVPGFQEQLDSIMYDERGARWANRAMSALSKKNPSEAINRALLNAQRTQRPEIEVDRLATAAEVDVMVSSGQISRAEAAKPQYKTDHIGTIAGLPALAIWPELREILVDDLRPNLERLAGLAVGELTYKELNQWSRLAAGITAKLSRAQEVLNYCGVFLQLENLSQLEAVEPDKGIRRDYRNFIVAGFKNEFVTGYSASDGFTHHHDPKKHLERYRD